MALPRTFKFSAIAAVQSEGDRRASLMFGKVWRTRCFLSQDSARLPAIACDDNMLSYNATKLAAWRDGTLNDLLDGSCAEIEYYHNGETRKTSHYIAGTHQNPTNGISAVVCYFPNGSIQALGYCRDILDNGLPATVDYPQNGTVKAVCYCWNGDIADQPDGFPASICYSDVGEITGGTSSVAGSLTAAETIARIKDAQVRRVANLLEKADQSVLPIGMPLSDVKPAAAGDKEKAGVDSTQNA